MRKEKPILLLVILISQVFCWKYIILPQFRDVKPGQVWKLEYLDDVHYSEVIFVTNDWVLIRPLPGNSDGYKESLHLFVETRTLTTNKPSDFR